LPDATPRKRWHGLSELAAHLPDTAFTAQEFLDFGTGINAIQNSGDVWQLLEALTELGVIRQVDDDERPVWIRCTAQSRDDQQMHGPLTPDQATEQQIRIQADASQRA
jgi:hypothetical protein